MLIANAFTRFLCLFFINFAANKRTEMKILILAAMQKELDLLLAAMDHNKCVMVDGLPTHQGRIGHHDVIAAKCGIGKVNSAINAFRLIRELEPALVVNSGVAGGADPSLPVGTLLVASQVSNHDSWCGPGCVWGATDGFPKTFHTGERILEIARALAAKNPGIRTGLICSGDRFITSAEEIEAIRGNFPEVEAVDMESAPIMQVCKMLGVECNIIRIVSDTPGSGNNISDYEEFFRVAPEETFHFLKYILSEY